MSTYEAIVVVRPDLDEEALNAVIERVHQRIVEVGGEIASTDRWGKRRIAYPIRKYRDGFYLMTVFSLASGQVARLRQTLGLNEDLLRFVVAAHRVAQKPAAAAAPAAAPAAGTTTPPPGTATPPPGTATPPPSGTATPPPGTATPSPSGTATPPSAAAAPVTESTAAPAPSGPSDV